MLPQDQAIVITVSDCRIIVCRRRELSEGAISYECAQNAEELEGEAMVAVARYGHPFQPGQEVPCPPELAAQAQWN